MYSRRRSFSDKLRATSSTSGASSELVSARLPPLLWLSVPVLSESTVGAFERTAEGSCGLLLSHAASFALDALLLELFADAFEVPAFSCSLQASLFQLNQHASCVGETSRIQAHADERTRCKADEEHSTRRKAHESQSEHGRAYCAGSLLFV